MLLRSGEGWAMAWRQIMVGAGGNYGIDREDGYRNSMGYVALEGIKRRESCCGKIGQKVETCGCVGCEYDAAL